MCFLYLCLSAGLAKQKWKVSKAMENNLVAKKEIFKKQEELNVEFDEYSEAKLRMKNIKSKSVKELQAIFYPIGDECQGNVLRNLSRSHEIQGKCVDYEPRWVLMHLHYNVYIYCQF